ncbi:hypothetical protein B0O99DRAFT_594512 [Bisporella sp. PMI_857]|nr:hypothetical protein B0O99DRAFT_594512 [Bisporella sp. PMI_857]
MEFPITVAQGLLRDCSASPGALVEPRITGLLWFQSIETLKKAENSSPSSFTVKRLREEAMPSTILRKWVATILPTIRVPQNAVLLALICIYRLKIINPQVKGRTGSEYRVFTAALMLGKRFLDDNSYTNKT